MRSVHGSAWYLYRFDQLVTEWEGRDISMDSYLSWLGKKRRVLDINATYGFGLVNVVFNQLNIRK
jgi:hypothetical protein